MIDGGGTAEKAVIGMQLLCFLCIVKSLNERRKFSSLSFQIARTYEPLYFKNKIIVLDG